MSNIRKNRHQLKFSVNIGDTLQCSYAFYSTSSSQNTQKCTRCHQIALRFQTFADHGKSILNLKSLHESMKKAGVFSCNIRMCSELLWIRQFYLLSLSLSKKKRRTRCHQTVPRFQNFPRGAYPWTPPPPQARLCAYGAKLHSIGLQTIGLRAWKWLT